LLIGFYRYLRVLLYDQESGSASGETRGGRGLGHKAMEPHAAITSSDESAADRGEYRQVAGANGPNEKQSPKHVARGFLRACLWTTAWLVAQLNTTE
jgi:hypothetical protein